MSPWTAIAAPPSTVVVFKKLRRSMKVLLWFKDASIVVSQHVTTMNLPWHLGYSVSVKINPRYVLQRTDGATQSA